MVVQSLENVCFTFHDRALQHQGYPWFAQTVPVKVTLSSKTWLYRPQKSEPKERATKTKVNSQNAQTRDVDVERYQKVRSASAKVLGRWWLRKRNAGVTARLKLELITSMVNPKGQDAKDKASPTPNQKPSLITPLAGQHRVQIRRLSNCNRTLHNCHTC